MNLIKRYKKFSQLRKNVFSGAILAGVSIILLLIAYPIYIRYLGVERYGLWAVVSVVLTFSQIGDLGINEAVIKYTAEEYGKKNFHEIESYIVTANLILIIPSLLIIFILVIFNENILNLLKLTAGLHKEVKYLIPMFGILTSLIFYSNITWGALKGVGRADLANYIFAFSKLLQVMISIILIVLGLGVWGLFLGNFVLYVFLFIFCFFILRKVFKLEIFRFNHFDIRKIKKLIKFGGTMFGGRIIVMFLDPFNRIFIARFANLSAVAYYDISLKAVMGLRSLFEMGLRNIMQKVSELNSRSLNSRLEISNIHNKGMKFILFFASPLFVSMFLFGKPVLNLWLGDSYNLDILISLRIFLVAYFINLLCVPAYYIFMGLGRVRLCFYHAMIQSLINVAFIVFTIIFLKKIEYIGVVLACSTGVIASSLFVLVKFKILKKNFCLEKIIPN